MFSIFAGVVFSLQAASIGQNVEALVGADIVVQSARTDLPINEEEVREYLEDQKRKGAIVDYGFVSFSIRRLTPIHNSRFSTLSYFPNNAVVCILLKSTLIL